MNGPFRVKFLRGKLHLTSAHRRKARLHAGRISSAHHGKSYMFDYLPRVWKTIELQGGRKINEGRGVAKALYIIVSETKEVNP